MITALPIKLSAPSGPQECHDTVEEDDGRGRQKLFRLVRIPFRVVCVSGNLKMRLRVEQDRSTRQVRTLPRG